jgi:hypothetical protein
MAADSRSPLRTKNVFVGTSVMRLSIARFALVNVAIVVLWIGLALVVLNRHQALVQRCDEAA